MNLMRGTLGCCQMLAVVFGYGDLLFSDGTGSLGLTPYFLCLARPQGQPPKVTTISML